MNRGDLVIVTWVHPSETEFFDYGHIAKLVRQRTGDSDQMADGREYWLADFNDQGNSFVLDHGKWYVNGIHSIVELL